MYEKSKEKKMNSFDLKRFGEMFDEYRRLITKAVKENKEIANIKIENITESKCDDIGCYDRVTLKITITHTIRGGEIGELMDTDKKELHFKLDAHVIKGKQLNTKWLYETLLESYKYKAWEMQTKAKAMEELDSFTLI